MGNTSNHQKCGTVSRASTSRNHLIKMVVFFCQEYLICSALYINAPQFFLFWMTVTQNKIHAIFTVLIGPKL